MGGERMTKDEWYDNLEVTNQLTLAETAIARINVPNTNGKYIIIDKMPGMNPTEDDPILWIKGSIVTENDIFIRGSITSTTDFASGEESGGGALLLSHGWVGSGTQSNPIAVSPPLIQLMTSGTQIKSGPSLPTENMTDQAGQIFNHTGQNKLYIWSGSDWKISETIFSGQYDTLFLVKNDNYSPANLDLGDLTVHSKLMLKSTDSTFAVTAGDNFDPQYPQDPFDTYLIPQNTPNGGLGLGTYAYPFKWVDTERVFTDEIVNLHGCRIKFLLKFFLGRSASASSGNDTVRTDTLDEFSTLDDEETSVEVMAIDGDAISGYKQKHLNGLVDEWYSDDEVTLKAVVDGSTGNIMATGSFTLTNNEKWVGLRSGNTRLYSDADGVLKVQNQSGQLATLDASNIFTDHINSASAGGIYFFDNPKVYATNPQATPHIALQSDVCEFWIRTGGSETLLPYSLSIWDNSVQQELVKFNRWGTVMFKPLLIDNGLYFEEDWNVKLYRDGNAIRVQTPINGGLMVEQNLWCKNIAVDETLGIGGNLTINNQNPDDFARLVIHSNSHEYWIGCGGTGTWQSQNLFIWDNTNSAIVMQTDQYQNVAFRGALTTDNNFTLTNSDKWIGFRNGLTRLFSNANGVLQVQDENGSLATLDISNLFADHINSSTGQGIYIMDTLKPYSSAINIDGRIDSSSLIHGGGGNGDAFQVGDDCLLVDINYANRIGIQGTQDRNQAGLQFGSSGMWLYRDSSYLRCSSGFVADGTVGVGTYSSGGTGAALYCNANHQICQGTSLRAYKTSIETLDDASWIYSLRPVTFDWEDDRDAQLFGRQVGLIAEEVQVYAPLLTFNDDQTGQLRGVMYEKLAVPMLVELQRLRREVDELKTKLVE
jgi:hypothetical protein